MKPKEFDYQNEIYAKDQPEYNPLPVLKLVDGTVYSCWQLEPKEIERINQTGCFYLKQLTFNQPLQPICPIVDLDIDFLLTYENGNKKFLRRPTPNEINIMEDYSIMYKKSHPDWVLEEVEAALIKKFNIQIIK